MSDSEFVKDPMSSPTRFDPVSLRARVLQMAYQGATVHIACAFSIIELLAVLYRDHLRFPGGDPEAPDRDYLILSKGHGVMAQYACMYELGWLDDAAVDNYFADGTELKGLSDSRVRGLEVTSGSLGHGFSVGVGIALGLAKRGSDQRVYAIVGDGELNEGPIWEGSLVAAHHCLENFMVIVDKNGFQAMGTTDEVLRLGDVRAKFESFGFDAVGVDGHNEQAVHEAIVFLSSLRTGRPKALVARTVKGAGVSFMATDNRWHYTRLTQESMEAAMAELSTRTGPQP